MPFLDHPFIATGRISWYRPLLLAKLPHYLPSLRLLNLWEFSLSWYPSPPVSDLLFHLGKWWLVRHIDGFGLIPLFSYTLTHRRKLCLSYMPTQPADTDTYSTRVTASSFSVHHLVMVPSRSTLPKTHSILKSCQGRQDSSCLSLLFPLLLWYHCPAGCNISVADMWCNTSVNSCWLLLWALLWGEAKLQVAENDSEGTADRLAPQAPFWLWNPPLRCVNANTKMSKVNTGECVVITVTNCCFENTDTC